ncbi:hypothetical protein BYT27DRAFT_7200997 [Phlegmacium glaucopus]|nr:hypothetical protein BYT27DRAFT_7200997 [Phlegmacium glaucopus]
MAKYSFLGPTRPEIDEEPIDANGQSQEQASASQSTNDEHIVIPLDNVAHSLYPSSKELHDGSSSRLSQMLDVTVVPQIPGKLFLDQNTPTSRYISEPDNRCLISHATTSPQGCTGSSPIADTRRLAKLHRTMRGYPHPYRSNSRESIEQLGPGKMSSSHDLTPVAEPSCLSTDPPEISHKETLISNATCEDLKAPALCSHSIFPVAPENFTRHEKRRTIPREATTVKMGPILRDFSDHDDIPGWTTYIHPKGGRYFHHAEKKIFTAVDLHDSAYLKRISTVISKIDSFIKKHHIQISEKTDLVLDVNLVEDKYVTEYYFADHGSRIVFFLDEFSPNNLPHWSDIKGISSASGNHLRQALETQYWWHCHTYPNCIELTDDLICELRASLSHSISDCLSPSYANSPYTLENLQKLLGYTDSLKDNIGQPSSGCIYFLGRLMYSISNMKFSNFQGQPVEARLNRDQSIYASDRTNRRTCFIKTISMLLFSAPDAHLKTLQKMWVDGIMHKAACEQSFKVVSDEWREFILYATLLLNANVAFLAIQSVDINRNRFRSPAQISSYCSISCSVGSIVLGLFLIRQNQLKHRETVRDVQKFLTNRAHPWLGLETLAIMFSLPYALLMWGMLFFFMALWLMCLHGSGAVTRSVVMTVCSVILMLIIWCIWTSWEEQRSQAKVPEGRVNTAVVPEHEFVDDDHESCSLSIFNHQFNCTMNLLPH